MRVTWEQHRRSSAPMFMTYGCAGFGPGRGRSNSIFCLTWRKIARLCAQAHGCIVRCPRGSTSAGPVCTCLGHTHTGHERAKVRFPFLILLYLSTYSSFDFRLLKSESALFVLFSRKHFSSFFQHKTEKPSYLKIYFGESGKAGCDSKGFWFRNTALTWPINMIGLRVLSELRLIRARLWRMELNRCMELLYFGLVLLCIAPSNSSNKYGAFLFGSFVVGDLPLRSFSTISSSAELR